MTTELLFKAYRLAIIKQTLYSIELVKRGLEPVKYLVGSKFGRQAMTFQREISIRSRKNGVTYKNLLTNICRN